MSKFGEGERVVFTRDYPDLPLGSSFTVGEGSAGTVRGHMLDAGYCVVVLDRVPPGKQGSEVIVAEGFLASEP